MENLLLGLDVGGTNTDCVVQRGTVVIGSAKRPTSEDVTGGVLEAIRAAIDDAATRNAPASLLAIAERVVRVHIGTTHFVNATVQRKGLAPVAVFRLCGDASRALPPFIDFPPSLTESVEGCYFFLKGGFQFDRTPIETIDPIEVRACVDELRRRRPRCKNIVVSGVFSPLDESQEVEVEAIIKSKFPEASVTLSHQVGQTGLLERENAAILNECLKPLCRRMVVSLRLALNEANLTCPFYLTQNDGTVINAARASRFPILTISSGPTNSMRGAAFLSGCSDAIVVDVGGTTTDVGVLRRGFPREASSQVKIAEVKTNFRMPDVFSIGLGGGSLVDFEKNQIGPLSVGYEIATKALVFGGSTLTGTDIAVAANMTTIGNKADEVRSSLDSDAVKRVVSKIHAMVEDAVDRVKVTDEDVPVILVGGGSILLDEKRDFRGSSDVKKPPHYDVANAVGAALSQVGGSVDYVISDKDGTREEAHAEAKRRAVEKAKQAGAEPESIRVVEVDEIPLSYLPGNASRIKVKAIGDMKTDDIGARTDEEEIAVDAESETNPPIIADDDPVASNFLHSALSLPSFNQTASEPNVDPSTGEWILTGYDVECIAVGAGILGCGGGGSPELGRLRALESLVKGKRIKVATDLSELNDSDLVAPIAFMGAPTIIAEKLVGGREFHDGMTVINSLLSAGIGGRNATFPLPDDCNIAVSTPSPGVITPKEDFIKTTSSGKLVAVVSCEIGGMNSIEPLILGADVGLPVIDADGMGRAFPELQMFTPSIYGANLGPSCLVSEKGECVPVIHVDTAKQLEDFMRMHTVRMGCSAAVLFGPLTVADVKTKMVWGSLTRARRLGDVVLTAQRKKESPVAAILSCETGRLLIFGKIVDVLKTTEKGFSKGHVIVKGFDSFADATVYIALQNEFIVVRRRSVDGDALASVPDLITIIDSDTGYPISTEEVKYGLRVAVLVLAAHPMLRTERALQFVGPAAFGYDDVEFESIAEDS